MQTSTIGSDPRATASMAAGDCRSAPKVAIVILTWNDPDATMACLAALAETTHRNRSSIVVDNGSTIAFEQLADPRYPVGIVTNPTNLGYTGGVNIGIARALACGADYIWLLNNDAKVQPDTLSRLVSAAESDQRIGLVSPVFHDPDLPETVEFCLGRFDPESRYASQTADPAVAARWAKQHPDEIVLVGTALLIRSQLVEAIGGLDAAFFAYVEDVDYCLRARAAGFRVLAVPDAVVFHKFKQPTAKPGDVPAYLHYFITRNYLLLWRKLPRPYFMRKAMLWFLYQRLSQMQHMRDVPSAIDAVLSGLWDGLRGVGGAYRSDRRAPWLLRVILGRRPEFWLAVLNRRVRIRRDAT